MRVGCNLSLSKFSLCKSKSIILFWSNVIETDLWEHFTKQNILCFEIFNKFYWHFKCNMALSSRNHFVFEMKFEWRFNNALETTGIFNGKVFLNFLCAFVHIVSSILGKWKWKMPLQLKSIRISVLNYKCNTQRQSKMNHCLCIMISFIYGIIDIQRRISENLIWLFAGFERMKEF